MRVSQQPWLDTPPWNLLSADERRIEILALEPAREVLDVCLAVIDGVTPLLAEIGEPTLPRSWRDEPDIGFVVGLCAAAVARADNLSVDAIQLVAEEKGPAPLSEEDAKLLMNYILRQQLSGALHFATEHIGKRGNYTSEERLEIMPLVRKHWAALNFFKKKDCLQIIAESADAGAAAEFFRQLKEESETDAEVTALLETQLSRLQVTG